MTPLEQRTRDAEAAAQVQITEARNQKGKQGSYDNPIRYARIEANDPNRKAKLAAQWDQAEKDAHAGKVLCLSDLMCNSGM